MWKDKRRRKNLAGIYVDYEVIGLNQNHLLATLKNSGIELYNVKKHSNKRLTLTVSLRNCEKFFALTNELCYNVTRLNEHGLFCPVLNLLRNFGLIIGFIIFFCCAIYFSDIMFSVKYTGTGSIYSREVSDYLEERGITRNCHFADIDTKKLSYDILSSNEKFSFVNCYKEGNRLIVELILSPDKDMSHQKKKILKAENSGEIIDIKVYKGHSLFKIGDNCKSGDILVEGELMANGQRTDVLAVVQIKVSEQYTYRSENDGEEDVAIIFAEQNHSEKEVNSSVTVTHKENIYNYEVTTSYVCTMYAT